MKSSKMKSALAFAVIAAASLAMAPASAYEISTTGSSGPFALAPSADTVSFNSNTTSTANLGNFNFQTGNYVIGNSGFLSGSFTYTFSEDVTIDGQTQAVSLSLLNRVSNPDQDNTDSLTISQATPVFFSDANVFFNINTYQSPNVGVIGQNTPFTLIGFLAAGPVVTPPETPVTGEVPEPSSIALLLAGSLGLIGFAKRRRSAAAKA